MIGRGTFGIVMMAVLKEAPSMKCALKYLVPTSCTRAYSEIQALQAIGDHENVIHLLTTTRYQDQVVLVFPYFENTNFKSLIDTVTLEDVQYYMHSLLKGLAYIHSKEIIHRDVKPGNFLYNKSLRTGKLIDFGLAQTPYEVDKKLVVFKRPGVLSKHRKSKPSCSHNDTSICTICTSRRRKNIPRAGTNGYRAPEILLEYQHQTSILDIWSAGVVLLSLLSKKYPFFRVHGDSHALAELVAVFGTNVCTQAAENLGMSLILSENIPGVSLQCFYSVDSTLQSSDLFIQLSDLAKDMLTVNPLDRKCASQLLLEYKIFETH